MIQSLEGEGSGLFSQDSCLFPQVLIVLEFSKYLAWAMHLTFAWLESGPLLVNMHRADK